MSKSPEVIILHETVAHSIAKDVISISALTAGVGLGVWMQSGAMQWVAGILWVLYLLSAAFRTGQSRRMTIEAARKRLDELETNEGQG